jgi:hypothetical protein
MDERDWLAERFNGTAGWVSLLDGEVYAIAALTLQNGRITTMDILLDPHASPVSTSQPSTPVHDGTRIDPIARSRRPARPRGGVKAGP